MFEYQDLNASQSTKIPSDYLVQGIYYAIIHHMRSPPPHTHPHTPQGTQPAIINISITMWRSVALETIIAQVRIRGFVGANYSLFSQAIAFGIHVVVGKKNLSRPGLKS